jgi:acetyl esterase/lipase
MSQETERHEITKKRVIYTLPGVDAVTVRRDVPYRVAEAGALTMDVYYPPDARSGERLPAVVFVLGYSDIGGQSILGCKFKEMGSFISWAQLVAASGMVAITYTNGKDPAADVHALLQHLRQSAESLGVDGDRIGLWASSGHVPNALSVLMEEPPGSIQCAALCYGLMLDCGSTIVADAAKVWRFVHPAAGRSVADLPPETPLLIVRAGRDEMPRLNEAMDLFLAQAVASNRPITFVNHPTAPHAFDILEDSETSREVIRQILAFLRSHLSI